MNRRRPILLQLRAWRGYVPPNQFVSPRGTHEVIERLRGKFGRPSVTRPIVVTVIASRRGGLAAGGASDLRCSECDDAGLRRGRTRLSAARLAERLLAGA